MDVLTGSMPSPKGVAEQLWPGQRKKEAVTEAGGWPALKVGNRHGRGSLDRHYANSAGFLNGGNDGKKKKIRGQKGSRAFPPQKRSLRALRARDSLSVQEDEALSPL